MAVPITKRQNESTSISLLAAQRHLYTKAKRYRTIRLALAIALALGGPILAGNPDVKPYLALIGVSWLIFDAVFGAGYEVRVTETAAMIQEEFDMYVLGLLANRKIKKARPETILSSEQDFKGEKQDLFDWYGKPEPLPGRLNALLCMRTNLVWDSHLRRVYAGIVSAVTALFVGGVVAYGLHKNLKVADILMVLSTSASLIVHNVRTVIRHLEVANNKDTAEREVMKLWNLALEQDGELDEQELRDLQDDIYENRKTAPPVPDVVYKRLKSRQNQHMEKVLAQFQREAKEFMKKRKGALTR